MKKLFTLCLALVGLSGVANAATVDDILVTKHSYVLVADEYTNNGTGSRAKGSLFGSKHFLDVTGGTVATNKGKIDLSVVDDTVVTAEIAAKYGQYGSHLNSLRLKKTQDVIAMRVTAGSKLIIFYQDNNKDDRYPVFAEDAGLTNKFAVQGTVSERRKLDLSVSPLRRMEWTAPDDKLVYIGDNNGDMFISYIIVEANEAPGTPTVTVGDQTFENGLYFQEVTCTPTVSEGISTVVTYTTDGSEPTESSTKYTEPIKCYADQTVKFQAYYDIMDEGVNATLTEEDKVPNADNEAVIEFSFDAPAITADGVNVTISSQYQNATNYYSLNGGEDASGDNVTLEESATVKAYTKIANGTYGTFTSKSASTDVYVLDPITEKKVITVSAGDVVLDEEATASSTTGDVYKVENGEISADKYDFFVKNLTFGVIKNADYQIDGEERYIQMSNTNITFKVPEGQKVDVTVTCSKNSCKNIDAADAAADKLVNGCTPDRSCYVNVSGKNYCALNEEGKEVCDQKLYPGIANIIKFTLDGGTYTFQKYSGTGAIFIHSIEFVPQSAVIKGDVNGDEQVSMADANAVVNYFLADEDGKAQLVEGGFNVSAADVNEDNTISMADANKIVNIYLGTE